MHFKEKRRMQGGNKQNSSVVIKSGTTSGRMPAMRQTRDVPARGSLSHQQLRLAQARRNTRDYIDVETIRLNEKKHRREPETWDDDQIPVYSRGKDQHFNMLLALFGAVI